MLTRSCVWRTEQLFTLADRVWPTRLNLLLGDSFDAGRVLMGKSPPLSRLDAGETLTPSLANATLADRDLRLEVRGVVGDFGHHLDRLPPGGDVAQGNDRQLPAA